jgi:hypothetical protein
MTDEVDFTYSPVIPKIHVQNEHAMLDLIAIYLLASPLISNDKSDTWWRSDGSSILVSKTTHSSAPGLLNYLELVSPAIISPRYRYWRFHWLCARSQRYQPALSMHCFWYRSPRRHWVWIVGWLSLLWKGDVVG